MCGCDTGDPGTCSLMGELPGAAGQGCPEQRPLAESEGSKSSPRPASRVAAEGRTRPVLFHLRATLFQFTPVARCAARQLGGAPDSLMFACKMPAPVRLGDRGSHSVQHILSGAS